MGCCVAGSGLLQSWSVSHVFSWYPDRFGKTRLESFISYSGQMDDTSGNLELHNACQGMLFHAGLQDKPVTGDCLENILKFEPQQRVCFLLLAVRTGILVFHYGATMSRSIEAFYDSISELRVPILGVKSRRPTQAGPEKNICGWP